MQIKTPENSTLFTIHSNSGAWTFHRPGDPDEIVNQITDEEFEKDQFLPYWAEHWPASEVLFSYCADNLKTTFGSVCELGCGLGVVSALLASRGYPVLATDISPQACIYAAINMQKYASLGAVVCGDWRYSAFRQHFDCIIASDILYEKRWVEPVLTFLKNHLSEKGTALIVDPMRDSWELFKNRTPDYGFETIEIISGLANNGKTCVEILKLLNN